MAKRYIYNKEGAPADLKAKLRNISPVCVDILYKRGIQTEQEIHDFLFPNPQLLTDSCEFKDADKACTRIRDAIRNNEEIVVYHDYDVDGMCAGAIVCEVVTKLSGKVYPYVNSRSTGYGICQHGLEDIRAKYPKVKLIVTVDNGIVANDAVEVAKTMGFDVVVTDHHEPGDTLPDCCAVVDAKREDEIYPYRHFCGAGLAFKLMILLCRMMGRDVNIAMDTLDLATLATVADIVPLTGENRLLVKRGIECIKSNHRPFFAEAMEQCGIKQVTAHNTISFTYAPMLNALSRMDKDPLLGTQALLATTREEVRGMVEEMRQVNEERKTETQEEYLICAQMLQDEPVGSGIVVYHESLQEGIVGIVAGRLKEDYNRPAIVFSMDEDGNLRGSARSIPEAPMIDILRELSGTGLILQCGGHKLAAGLTIREADFDSFKAAFLKITDRYLKGKNLEATEVIDYALDEGDLSVELVQDIRMLEPYGEGWRQPLFGLRFEPDDVMYMGKEKNHAKYTKKGSSLCVIKWGGTEEAQQRAIPWKRSKFVGYPDLNQFRDTVTVQFVEQQRG